MVAGSLCSGSQEMRYVISRILIHIHLTKKGFDLTEKYEEPR